MESGLIFFGPVEYKTTRKSTKAVGVERATTIEPPDGWGWDLVSVCIEGSEVFYFWKRNAMTANNITVSVSGFEKAA